ncbi:MAG: F0F1 ATP synthase subunit gamma [Candidatus Omnitrophota bacterium]
MRTIAEIKKDMEFNKSLSVLVETLKTIAVSQYRALEKKTYVFEEFNEIMENFFDFLDLSLIKHAFVAPTKKAQAIIAITSDAGFLGGLNLKIIEASIRELRKMPGKLIIIGERGKMYVRGTDVSYVAFPGIIDEERFAQAQQLRDYIVNNVVSDTFHFVKIIYPRPVSFTVQRVEVINLFPYVPAKSQLSKEGLQYDVIIESRLEDMVEYLLYLWAGQRLSEIFGLSRLAEFSARYVHLEESTQKLKDIDEKVKLQYFRVRHELVDRTMRELFAGRALYGKK